MSPDAIHLIIGLLKALLATIVIEELVASFWREWSWWLFLTVFCANVLTNPVINLAVYCAPDFCFDSAKNYYVLVLILETLVWISESAFFWKFGKIHPFVRASLFSLTLNLTSYCSGFVLERLNYWN